MCIRASDRKISNLWLWIMKEQTTSDQGRVVSHKTDFPWPPKSPDLNPLDFYVWGFAEKEDCDKQPKSFNQLNLIVENFAREIPRATLFNVADNFRTREQNFACKKLGVVLDIF